MMHADESETDFHPIILENNLILSIFWLKCDINVWNLHEATYCKLVKENSCSKYKTEWAKK